MRKSKKTIAILAIIAMVLMMIPVQAFAAGNASATSRLSGATRVDTAIAIANSGWANGATNVIVVPANDENLVDALAVAPLAKQLNAPILITDKASLDASVSAEIATLKAANVYAVGALSDAVASQLKALSGVTVNQVKGADRFATAAQIASMLKSPAGSIVVGYNGLADALSAASYAAANGYAILVANTDGTVPASEATYEGSKVIVLGGPTLVADIAGATRYFGADRYATNDAVVKNLSFKYDKVYVANGDTLVDALSGAVLAALSNSPIVLANTQGAAAAADVFKNLSTSSQVVAFGGTGVVPDSVVTGVQTGNNGGSTAPSGPVTVASVKATAANAITVTFSAAPADTSKVAFAVTRSTSPVAVTTSWDSTKTVATLTGSANFPEGSYSVSVKNDTTDLGTSTVSFTQQKIAKINITSTKLAVVKQPVSGNAPGYFTYNVMDQYGNDITTSYLANNLTFNTGVGSVSKPTPGVARIDAPTVNLMTMTTVVVTAYDSTSGVSVSATLTPSTALGTLSSITLNKLTNVNNAVLKAGDTSDTWYIDYTALDMSGNPTKDYNLVSQGLILPSDNSMALTTSNSNVVAKVVKDPSNNNNAAIQVTVVNSQTTSMDLPVSITAMAYQGSPSTLTLTLKKQSSIDTFTLMAPSQNIASAELKQIPFVAYDQDGNQLTKYDDLNNSADSNKKVTVTGFGSDGGFVRNPDGTASLFVRASTVSGNQSLPQILTAVTPTGKLSTLTLNIQPVATANKLAFDSSVVVSSMQENAVEAFDFGYDYGGMTVNDQYGRAMDLDTLTGNTIGNQFEVIATTTGSALNVAELDSGENLTTPPAVGYAVAANGTAIAVVAGTNLGSANRTQSVNFYLIKKTDQAALIGGDTTKAIDSQSVTFSVLKNTDISGYAIASVSAPIYAFTPTSTTWSALTHQQKDWAANPYVFGTTSGGGKVMLANGFIKGVYVDSSDFVAGQVKGALSNNTNAFDSVKVVAYALDPSKSSSSTNLTVTILGADNLIHTVTTAITSSSAAPVAKNLYLGTDTTTGMHLSDDGNTVYLDNATGLASLTTGTLLQRNDMTANGGAGHGGNIWFFAKDSYGKKGMNVSNIYVVDSGTSAGSSATPLFAVDSNLKVSTNTLTNQGDYVVLSAVTNNGLIMTIKIVKNY